MSSNMKPFLLIGAAASLLSLAACNDAVSADQGSPDSDTGANVAADAARASAEHMHNRMAGNEAVDADRPMAGDASAMGMKGGMPMGMHGCGKDGQPTCGGTGRAMGGRAGMAGMQPMEGMDGNEMAMPQMQPAPKGKKASPAPAPADPEPMPMPMSDDAEPHGM